MTTDKGLAGWLVAREEVVPGVFKLPEVERHNQSRVSGFGPIDITTQPEQWAWAATFPFHRPEGSGAKDEVLLIRVEVEVHSGRIGIGCVARDLWTYVVTEVDCTPKEGPTVLELPLENSGGECGCLVVRNTAEGSRHSCATVRSIRTFRTAARRIPDLMEVEACPIPSVGPERATRRGSRDGASRKFQILLTHTSRDWIWRRCTREFLACRYTDPKRLLNLPPFEELPPSPPHLYSGGLSILDLSIDRYGAHMTARRSIDSRLKIAQATVAGSRLVLCFDGFIAVLPAADATLENVDLRPGSPWRIDDNWFSDLHTVFPVNDDICIVASSATDAVLWVDLRSREVIRRWRLPADIYGVNYELTPEMRADVHHIHNDIQLAHLNCAYPDGKGGCYVSTLGQGDIGHVDEDGRYAILARGYVGCHGVRLSEDGRDLYFSDTCGGRLMQFEPDGSVRERWSVDSRWLHDVEQIDKDLYAFCLGDRNEMALVDIANGEELGRFAFDSRGVNVQFLSVIRDHA